CSRTGVIGHYGMGPDGRRVAMSRNSGQGAIVDGVTGRQKVLYILVMAAFSLLFVVSLQTQPIPSGRENCEKARVFLKEQVPDRAVAADGSKTRNAQLTAPVAVIYELIRSGEPEVAQRAIEFAAEQRFGYAAPYVIGRLGSGDPELESNAQNYLRTIAGGDYGPDAESWREWWHD